MNVRAQQVNEAVQISVPALVRLNRHGASVPLRAGRIAARQSGDYQSPFKGRGMEFDESRPYQPGDDIRNIDWRVTARTGRPHTKMFREERERPVFLWVDFRGPMFFATRGCYKSVLAAQLASLLAWSAAQQGDRVGAVIFSEDEHHEIKPQRGKAAVLQFIRRMVEHPAWRGDREPKGNGDSGGRALARLRRVARPGSLVFLLSDFRDLDERAESQLVRLGRSTDLVMVMLHDPLERDLPPPGQYPLSNGRDEFLLDTFNTAVVGRYRERFVERSGRLELLARRNGMHFILCGTHEDPLAVLQAGLNVPRGR
ncbi:MAG: DUF58 domain-containing protein [Gammaproteobacteria bacterium]|nr:DUF58 domain-containing protein [Gammaproteobacteria bacterium]